MPAQRRHEPVRTCVGCREEASKRSLIRLVRRAEGGAAMDLSGQARGRGAYLHRAAECIDAARRRRTLERALGTPIQPELWPELID